NHRCTQMNTDKEETPKPEGEALRTLGVPRPRGFAKPHPRAWYLLLFYLCSSVCICGSMFYFFPCTNLFGVPSSGPPCGGRQSTTSSIFRASAKSLSVMPPAECVLSLTHTLPQVTVRSGWWYAASAR